MTRRGVARGCVLGCVAALTGTAGVSWAAGLSVTSARLGATAVAAPALYPTAVAVANNGEAGKVTGGDTVTVTFTGNLKQSTVCSSWTGAATARNQPLLAAVLVDGGAGPDTLTLTPGQGCSFGTLSLGSTEYVTGGNHSYETSTLSLTAAPPYQLRLLLGGNSGVGATQILGANTMTYTPDAAMTDTSTPAVSASPSTASSSGQTF